MNNNSLPLHIFLTFSISFFLHFPPSASSSEPQPFSVLTFGAKPGGTTDATGALQKAWKAACNASGPATIDVPEGRYLTRPVVFDGKKCRWNMTMRLGGTLVAPNDHRVLGKVENWVTFKRVSGLCIVGEGGFDAKGVSWWSCKESSGKTCTQQGATTLRLLQSSDVSIDGLMSLNSHKFHIGINGCRNIRLHALRIVASETSPNTDGVHVQSSMHVTVSNSTIGTGDDCISIGPGTKNLWVQNVTCGPGHGISIGSLGNSTEEQGVKNVTIKTVVFNGTSNGVRIKTWERPSNSFIQDVHFEDVVMQNVRNPIIIDQIYCPNRGGCPNQASGVKISNVTYKGIRGTSATKFAMAFNCSLSNPCGGIRLEDINITRVEKEARSICKNAIGITMGVILPKSCLNQTML